MSNVVTMRPNAPLTPEQQVNLILEEHDKAMADLGIDLTEDADDEQDEQE